MTEAVATILANGIMVAGFLIGAGYFWGKYLS